MSRQMGKRQRCAIYTRKSTETGLEQDFNSLDAQREACEAFIKSQAHEGWKVLPKLYDDGGLSGGTLERPALQSLLEDIEAGHIDVVVVYKVDRLTRSLTDFAKLVDLFERCGVSFVSVTQQFNTTSSMGRLTLNVLLSFAQFEREVIGERIRDKVAQSKAKGIWMGGLVPLGYDLGERELLVNPIEAKQVREIFELYLQLGSIRALKIELDRRGMKTKRRHQKDGRITGGGPFSRGHLYCLLSNPLYIGKIPHKGKLHEGKHEAIVNEELWHKVQELRRTNRKGTKSPAAKHPSLLAGKLETADGQKLIPSHAVKTTGINGEGSDGTIKIRKRYRYYIEQRLVQDEGVGTKGTRYAADEVESAVLTILKRFLESPTDVAKTMQLKEVSPSSLKDLVARAKALGEKLKDQHQTLRIVSAVVEKVIVHETELELHLSKPRLGEILGVTEVPDDPIHIITSPCKLARRGQDLKFILPLLNDPEAFGRKDPALIQAVAKAHLWWEGIKDGEIDSLTEIARREGIDKAQVTRWIRLTFLSPSLARKILAGTQPTNLTIEILTRDLDLPLTWKDQENRIDAIP
jgi:DNA invertase Pin-like site-specific DNA recombinase